MKALDDVLLLPATMEMRVGMPCLFGFRGKGDFSSDDHCVRCVCVCACLFRSCQVLCPSFYRTVAVSLLPSLPPSSGSTGGAAVGRSSWGSHPRGVFRVSWHLGERFQLVRDPCVHFYGFAGE